MTRFINIIGTLALACMLLVGMAPAPANAQVSVGIGLSVSFGPPAIPVYEQPPAPGLNYIWQPGYWAYDPVDGYYWVPGTWVAAPSIGLYWTPGYWAYNNGAYAWDPGYWGPVVGFYGGINYGYGYYGNGYVGGRWDHDYFRYNTAINNVNVTVVHNYVYSDRAVYHPWNGSVAYNGGPHGIQARPTVYDRRAYSERRYGMTPVQIEHATYAKQDPVYRYNTNHGRVPREYAAAQRPFTSPRALPAYHPAAMTHDAPAQQHAAPVQREQYHAPVQQHAAPVQREQYHAPAQQHAAPVQREQYHAPAQQHAAPVQREQYHAPAQQHAAPAPQHQYYQKPRSQAPAQHAYQPQARPQPAARPQQQGRPQQQARPQQQSHPAPKPSRGPLG